MTSQPSLIPHVLLIKLFLSSGSSGVVIKQEAKAEASLRVKRGARCALRVAFPQVEAIQQQMNTE